MSFGLKNEISYFFKTQYYAWKGLLTYRANASLFFAASMLTVVAAFITISVVYNVSSGITGWSYYQMLFLAATGTIAFWAISYLINPWVIVQNMQRGSIDPYIIRPYGRLTVLFANNYNNVANISVVSGLILLAYAALHLQFSLLFLIEYIVLLAVGITTIVLFIMMLALGAYHIMKNANSVSQLMNLSRTISTYPLSVYGILGQLAFTLLFPIGLAYYYPSKVFLGETGTLAFVAVLIVSIAAAVICYKAANLLARKYTSGGG